MKKAKVSHKHGLILRVWPWEKTLPDGTKVIKEIPPIYLAKGDKFDHCIIDVPDEVQPGWRWDGEKYAPKKIPAEKTKRELHSDIVAVLADELGLDYDTLIKRIAARKKDRSGKVSNS